MEDAWYLDFKGCFYLHVGAPDHREQRYGYNEESHWLSEALLRSTCIHHHYRHGMLSGRSLSLRHADTTNTILRHLKPPPEAGSIRHHQKWLSCPARRTALCLPCAMYNDEAGGRVCKEAIRVDIWHRRDEAINSFPSPSTYNSPPLSYEFCSHPVQREVCPAA
jgi:hypothetical protein